jgi:hypothetical protein
MGNLKQTILGFVKSLHGTTKIAAGGLEKTTMDEDVGTHGVVDLDSEPHDFQDKHEKYEELQAKRLKQIRDEHGDSALTLDNAQEPAQPITPKTIAVFSLEGASDVNMILASESLDAHVARMKKAGYELKKSVDEKSWTKKAVADKDELNKSAFEHLMELVKKGTPVDDAITQTETAFYTNTPEEAVVATIYDDLGVLESSPTETHDATIPTSVIVASLVSDGVKFRNGPRKYLERVHRASKSLATKDMTSMPMKNSDFGGTDDIQVL